MDTFYDQPTWPTSQVPTSAKKPLPKTIGPYNVQSHLNHGGMSDLYLAQDPKTSQLMAIKVLSQGFINRPEMVDQFIKESEAISIADHEHIVKLYGQGKWHGGLYIAMEFIRGLSLKQFIFQQPLSVQRSLKISLQVAYALMHLHTHGIVHRDVKPDNILINEEGQVKVIDFGIAQLHVDSDLLQEAHDVIGTPSYMSPELKENPRRASFSSDIYALGVVTYEMLIGQLSQGHINFDSIPKPIKPFLTKALADKVEDRYQDIVDYISDLSALLRAKETTLEQTPSLLFSEEVLTYEKSLHEASNRNTNLRVKAIYPKDGHILSFFSSCINFGTKCLYVALQSQGPLPQAVIARSFLAGCQKGIVEKISRTEQNILNRYINLLREDGLSHPFAKEFSGHLVLLDDENDTLEALSFGSNPIFQLSSDGKTNQLSSVNSMLSSQEKEYATVEAPWYPGDRLILEFFLQEHMDKETKEKLLHKQKQVLHQHQHLILDALASQIYERTHETYQSQLEWHKSAVICLEYIER